MRRPVRLGQACVLLHEVNQQVAQELGAPGRDDVIAVAHHDGQEAQDAEELVEELLHALGARRAGWQAVEERRVEAARVDERRHPWTWPAGPGPLAPP